MNQTFFHKRAYLNGLRDRAKLATSEFYAKAGVDAPVRRVRFIVEPRGNNVFEVRERSTDQLKGIRNGHADSCQFAQQLEDNADALTVHRASMRRFAQNMLGWTATFCILLLAAAVSAYR